MPGFSRVLYSFSSIYFQATFFLNIPVLAYTLQCVVICQDRDLQEVCGLKVDTSEAIEDPAEPKHGRVTQLDAVSDSESAAGMLGQAVTEKACKVSGCTRRLML